MVVQVPADMSAVMLEGSHSARYVADTFYDGRPTLTGLQLTKDGSISARANGNVQTSGRVLIRSDSQLIDGSGNSIAPSAAVDALATYGQEIVISRQVYLGAQFIGAVPLGRFTITEVPSIEQTARRYGSARVIESSSVEVVFKDQLEPLMADDFLTIEAPRAGSTVWDEVRRLSSIPVVQTLADTPVSTTAVYDKSRLDTIYSLLAILKGVPHVTRSGALSGRLADPFTAASPRVLDLTGTITPMSRSMTKDFYNIVVITTIVNGVQQIVAEARITTGPMRWNGPAGARVYQRSAGLAATQVAAQGLADTLLANLSTGRTRTVKVTALPNVAIELGDAVRVTDPQTNITETGTVAALNYPMDPRALMSIDIDTKVTE